MTMADIVIGLSIVVGFFVAAAVSRIFRRAVTGILVGGVVGLGVSVGALFYGMDQLFPDPMETVEDMAPDDAQIVPAEDTTAAPADE